jgi:transcriptional regulator with XRE-family HTH domain
MSVDSLRLIGRQVGARLREARLAKNYTQSQLARPEFSVSYISAIERGQIQPSLRALQILADKLEINSIDLLPAPEPSAAESSLVEKRGQEEDQFEIGLLEAQLAIHQGQPERAIELLQNLNSQEGEVWRASSYRSLLGWAYLETDAAQEGEQLLAGTVRDVSDPLYPRILDLQMAAYTAMHNTEQAVQLQQVIMAYLDAHPSVNPFFRARLYSRLAQHHNRLGQIEQAEAMFKQALLALEVQDTQQRHIATCRQLSEAYRESGEARLAALYTSRWLLLDTQTHLLSLRRKIRHTLGNIALKLGSDEAYASFQRAAQEASAQRDPLALASAHVHLARWFLAHGDPTQAEHHVQEAQRLVSGETVIAADVQFLLGDLAYRRQDYPTADRHIEAGLAMLERLGEGEELIERLTQYARLLEERGLINKAILYWKRAYEKREKGSF